MFVCAADGYRSHRQQLQHFVHFYGDRVMKTAALFAWLLCSCASPPERYLTEAEDAEMRTKCEKTNCVVIPTPMWEQIKAFVYKFSGTAI